MRLPVSQKDAAGCGIACLAFALDISYDEVLNLLKGDPDSFRMNGIYCRDMVEVLVQKGVNAHWCYVGKKPPRTYQDNSIVFLGRSTMFPIGHFFIRWNGQWMDPWINYPSVSPAQAGWRKKLPEKPIYAVFVNEKKEL